MRHMLLVVGMLVCATPALADVAEGPSCDCGGPTEGEGEASLPALNALALGGLLLLLRRRR